ncbi:recombinase family protein [Epibacterium ulvae]|uniref:recombinase family protein n=1 Tax=Epibacterium ulvae TaxID=1156985 RepID=UPI0024915D62|nr:recombinase family protein [Epibacterium ulvae]
MKHWPPIHPKTPETGRLIGYARVSTEGQRLDLQLDALNGAGCQSIFEDHGVSGAIGARPGLDAALEALNAGDTLVVYKLDRLGRSVLHLADLITRLEKESIQFCSLTEGIDTTSAGGRLVFHIFAGVAEFGRDLIRENTLEGLRAARERGSRIGRPPVLSEEDILEAHRFVQQLGKTRAETAKKFGVSESTLRRGLARLFGSLKAPLTDA